MYKSAVQQLKEKFDVVNTSNAKLLYINRTLDCGSLNERQKKKIVEAIAKADDAKEAKVIYETLQNTVETKKEEKVILVTFYIHHLHTRYTFKI